MVESYHHPDAKKAKKSQRQEQTTSAYPFTFSAISKASLRRMLGDTIGFLTAQDKRSGGQVSARDLALTLNSRRSVFPVRAVFAARNLQDLKHSIQHAIEDDAWEPTLIVSSSSSNGKTTGILGVFTGQGAQWAGMGRRLLQDIPLASKRLSELEAALSNLPDPADRPSWSLHEELTKVEGSRLHLAEFAQPLCTALQIVLVDLLAAAGIRFAAVVGHSSGEIGAAYAAGVLSARDALVIAYYRGIHSSGSANGTKKGAMMAVGASPAEAAELVSLPRFKARISVAAHNSPTSVTLSGDQDAIEEAHALFADEGKFARILRVDKAYHSHHMKPCLEPYVESTRRAGVRAIRPPEGSCIWYSSVFGASGDSISSASDEHVLRLLDGEYWALNMAQTVLFSDAVEAAVVAETARGCSFSMAVEVGPHGALRGPFQDTFTAVAAAANNQQPLPYASCLARNTDDSISFSRAIGDVWAHDQSTTQVDLARFEATVDPTSPLPTPARNLPTYPWDHQRTFWHESRRSRALRLRSNAAHPLLGTLSPDSTATDLLWHNLLRIPDLPWLHGHRLQGQIIFPAAGYMAAAVEAALHVAAAARSTAVKKVELLNVQIGKAIAFEDESASGGVEMVTSLHVDDNHDDDHVLKAEFRFRSVVMGTEATDAGLNASGCVIVSFWEDEKEEGEGEGLTLLPPQQEEEAPARMLDVGADRFYSALGALGYHYSSSFRSLTAIKRKLNYARAELAVPAPGEMHRSETALVLHPGPLDALFQAVFLAYHWPGDGRLWSMHVPVSIKRIQIDIMQCRRSSDADQHLRIESAVTMDPSVSGYRSVRDGIGGDVTIFSGDGSRGLVQAEGVLLAPLAAASPADDVHMFLKNVAGVAFPDCHLAMTTTLGARERAPEQETELGWLLERISHFYLARLAQDIRPEEEARAQWHHQKLLTFARHTTERLREGKQPYGRAEWARDVLDPSELYKLMDEHGHTIDVRLMRAVGENLSAAVRGETVMLQHMMQDGMLELSYVETLGVAPYTAVLSATVEQITHVYPQLRMLEVGAGTGGATKSIMHRLHAARVGHYTFTDVSSGFFEAAEALFPAYIDAGLMSFRTLDLERDPVAEQDFEEHAYDLVVASFVLHATRDLDRTLRHVRRLLRPGGFLVMLEMTSNDPIRLSMTMGGLEGWWLGADAGRPWTPCVSAVQWHHLLLRNGFSGVETSTPDLDTLERPFGVLVSRAWDDQLGTLLAPSLEPAPSPSPSTNEEPCSFGELLVVAGSELPSVRLAERVSRILKPYCRAPITTLSGWREVLQLDPSSVKRPLTVLCLADLDERPLLEGIERDTFEGLKRLFALSPDEMLWVTRGAQTGERPYATASIGLGRAMMMEESRTALEFLDFVAAAEPDARLVADGLLRLRIIHAREQRTDDSTNSIPPPPLWSRETEVTIDAQGRRWVSRILPHELFNSSYNSARRPILTPLADPASDDIEIQDQCSKEDEAGGQPSSRSVVRVRHVESRKGSDAAIRIRPSYSSPVAIQEDWQRGTARTWTISIGKPMSTSTTGGSYVTAICLSDGLGSIVTPTPAESVFPWDDDHKLRSVDAPSYLGAVATYLVASLICREHDAEQRNCGRSRSTTTLLIDPNVALAQEVASSKLNIVCLTSSPARRASSPAGLYTFIDTNASSRAVRQSLTFPGAPVGAIIICSDATTQGQAGYRLARILQSSSRELRAARTRLVGDLLGEARQQYQDGGEKSILAGIFREAVERCRSALFNFTKLPDVDLISPRDYADKQRTFVTRTAVIDWSASCQPQLPVTARPLDGMHPLLRNDRTYLLLGLAGSGGLGLSLVEYLASQGACYFVLTSRNPSVDEELVASLARRGVRIQVLAQDVTHEPSLRKLVADLDNSADWPPIAGVANGAMVLADTTLQNMTFDQMTRVLRPKVEGTRVVDRVFHDKALDFFILFSSLSCVLGNSGQANYDAANMYLVGLAANRRARGLAASVVDIGAIMGTGYMAREVSDRTLALMVGAGFRKMSERDFLVAFANGMMAGCRPSEEPELITGLHVPGPDDEFQPAWVKNPRFSHVVAASRAAAGQTVASASSSQAESARDLLKRARTPADVSRIISTFTLKKISHMLQLSAEATSDHATLLQRGTASLGVDSLVAVEVRSWLMKEFDVDIPVFKILSNITIRDLLGFAGEALPKSLTPNLDRNSTDDAVPAEALAGPPKAGRDARVSKKQQQQSPSPREKTAPARQDGPQTPPLLEIDETFNKVWPDDTDGSSSSTAPCSFTTPITEAGGTSDSVSSLKPEESSLPVLRQNTTTTQQGVGIDKIRPMSYGQSRFWLMGQMVSDPCAFNVTNDIEITARIDKHALSKAVRSLGARHEALRTCFIRDSDSDHQDLMQAIMTESTLHLEMVQVNSSSEVEDQFLDLHKTVYDLNQGRLMRMILVSVSPVEHHLLLGYHHINMDSASTAILMSELFRLYAGQELPPSRIQQADLALHEQERLQGGHWAEQMAFWRRELAEASPDPLPMLAISPETYNKARPERSMAAYRSHSHHTRVSAKIAQHVQGLCRKVGVTPFHLYTTAFQVLLARLGHVDRVCIGMADANRSADLAGAAEEGVGNFLNLVPLVLETDLGQSVEDMARQTGEKILQVMSNAAVPFEIILECAQPQRRSQGHSPLFQAFIDYKKVYEKLEMPNGKGHLEGKQYLLSNTPYDILLDIIDNPSGEAALELRVQDGLYTSEEARRLLGCYVNLVRAFAESGGQAKAGEASMFDADKVEDALRLGQGK